MCFVTINESENKNISGGSDNGSAPNRRQVIIWTNADPVHWRIYAAQEGDDLYEYLTCH